MIYAIGGAVGGKAIDTVQAYDPVMHTWSNRPRLPRRRKDPSGAAVINGEIYVTGGQDSIFITKTLFVYNPATKLWKWKKSLPVPSRAGVSVAIGGKLYVYTPEGAVYQGAAHLHRYDPDTDRWTELATPPSGHERGAGGAINGKFYLAGGVGTGSSNSLHMYNPATNQWKSRPSMPTARFDAAGAVYQGKLWVLGGTNDIDDYDIVQVYDPTSKSWTTKTHMPTKRFSFAASVADGLLYALGGRIDATSTAIATNEVYIP